MIQPQQRKGPLGLLNIPQGQQAAMNTLQSAANHGMTTSLLDYEKLMADRMSKYYRVPKLGYGIGHRFYILQPYDFPLSIGEENGQLLKELVELHQRFDKHRQTEGAKNMTPLDAKGFFTIKGDSGTKLYGHNFKFPVVALDSIVNAASKIPNYDPELLLTIFMHESTAGHAAKQKHGSWNVPTIELLNNEYVLGMDRATENRIKQKLTVALEKAYKEALDTGTFSYQTQDELRLLRDALAKHAEKLKSFDGSYFEAAGLYDRDHVYNAGSNYNNRRNEAYLVFLQSPEAVKYFESLTGRKPKTNYK